MAPATFAGETFEQEVENFKSISKCSNYDTVAVSMTDARPSPFKANNLQQENAKETLFDRPRPSSKSNVFLRAARSITKTKSVSGNFIVTTMISKTAATAKEGSKFPESCKDVSAAATDVRLADFSSQVSPRNHPRAGRSVHAIHKTPNPLIKNSFASAELVCEDGDVTELASTPVYMNIREERLASNFNLSS